MKTRLVLLTIFIISLAAGVGLSVAFFRTLPGAMHLMESLVRTDHLLVGYLALAVLLQLLGHAIRAYKHKLLLDQIRRIELHEVFKGQMIGFLFNVLLPLRLGELIRAHYIGKGVLISRSAVFATIVFERLLDLLVVGGLGLGALLMTLGSFRSRHFSWLLLNALIGSAIIAALLWVARSQNRRFLHAVYHCTAVFTDRIRDRIRLVVWSFIYCLKNVIRRAIFKRYLLCTLAMWTAYLASIAVVVRAFLTPSALDTLQSTITAYLGVSTPLGPTYAANSNAQFYAVARTFSHDTTRILLTGFLGWLTLTLPSVILGIIYLVQKQRVKNTETTRVLDVMKNKLYRDMDISQEFGNYLDTYFQGSELNIILNNHEVAQSFTVIKTFKGGSNALTLLAWQGGVLVVKKITLPQFADKLSAQYSWLAERSHLNHIARVVGEQRHSDDYAIDIEYRDEFIPFFDFIHTSDQTASWHTLRRVWKFASRRLYEVTPINDQKDKLDSYLKDKVIGKVIDASNTNLPISQILTYKTIVVNGKDLLNFNQVIHKIQNNKQAMHDLKQFGESPIHGDLTIDNIIVDPSSLDYLLLDPNNENAISDPVTDYGKLFQSLHSGYEFLVLLKQTTVVDNRISFEEKRSTQYDYLYNKLDGYLAELLDEAQYRSIRFHEAVHYCRMLTYRVKIDPETAIAFYAVAIRLFNEFLQQYDRKK